MIRPTKDTTMTKHTREQVLALADAVPRLLHSGDGGAMNCTGIGYGVGADEWRRWAKKGSVEEIRSGGGHFPDRISDR